MKEQTSPARVVFIRHGESQRNEAKKGELYFKDEAARFKTKGVGDHLIPLTDEGFRQAFLTGEELCRRYGAPDVLYHSGYLRTIETAEGIMQAYPEHIRGRVRRIPHLYLRERDSGHGYDMTVAEAKQHIPFVAEHFRTTGYFFARPAGGESMADVAHRVKDFLRDELFAKHADQTVFIVTHGGTLRCLRFWLENWDYEQARTMNGQRAPSNCGVTVYERGTGDALTLKEYDAVFWHNDLS